MPCSTGQSNVLDELPWYRWWVVQQLRNQPQRLLLSLPDFDSDKDPDFGPFFTVWNRVQALIVVSGFKSIRSVTRALVDHGLLSTKNNYEAAQSAEELVFSILGWQTMLYMPDFTSCTNGEFRILNEMGGYRGETRVSLCQLASSSDQNLPTFLLGFGVMLPPRNYFALDEADDRALVNKTKSISRKDLHAHLLTNVCNVTIEWVDSLACHLELDRHSGKLFLFRYPSFCVSNLQQTHKPHKGQDGWGSVLHHCANERANPMPWGNKEDVTGLLWEILLSYRLIFGQERRSRAVFRKIQPFAGIPPQGRDPLLAHLCGRKRFECPVAKLVERDVYDLEADFPHLRGRIALLSGYAASRKPRNVRQLWTDRRDSTSWLALWSVLIFGSLSILLALLQTIFQILQYLDGRRQGGNG
ncbi:hypothetical protein N656DRAFT_774537 [Canariomyces notabilis]|uniref:Uncharacterized protein n=1 Tax=Canariomyces notabilis TaxID=2074819 RepID=A0AAN6TKX5_9PEZI|nr:hypothetical protein N656DRAFT_774537 [Canariomyces arenarius]